MCLSELTFETGEHRMYTIVPVLQYVLSGYNGFDSWHCQGDALMRVVCMLQVAGEDDAYFVDEFDDEAAMRELEALS